MNVYPLTSAMEPYEDILENLGLIEPILAELAMRDDEAASFPTQAFDLLREQGLLRAVLMPTDGGIGLGSRPASVDTLLETLMRLGAVHLSVARLFEGHVNAFALLWQYGTAEQRKRLSAYVRDGGLLAVWNAPAPEGPLRLLHNEQGLYLQGRKIFCSGAGSLFRPLLTAKTTDDRLLMLWPDVRDAQVDLSDWQVTGMRATATGSIDFSGIAVTEQDLFGEHDDYHRQPAFSGGAWRFAAAQLGAAGALIDHWRLSLRSALRDGDTLQRARLGDALIALESARTLLTHAAHLCERGLASGPDCVAYAGMARLAVEQVGMSLIAQTQRSIGLRSLMQMHPVERIARDLSTYLRQPVPDAVRDGIAAHALQDERPSLLRWLA